MVGTWEGGVGYRQAEAPSGLYPENVRYAPRYRPDWGHWGAPLCRVQPLINGKRGTGLQSVTFPMSLTSFQLQEVYHAHDWARSGHQWYA